MKTYPNWLNLLLSSVIAVSLVHCNAKPPEEEVFRGKVIDANTGQTIPKAIVLVRWTGQAAGPGGATSICSHVETAIANENGEYIVANWNGELYKKYQSNIIEPETSFDAYKFGYRSLGARASGGHDILLSPIEDADSRRRWFKTPFIQYSCGIGTDQSEANMRILDEAITKDLQENAKTDYEAERAAFYKEALDRYLMEKKREGGRPQ